jgi:hypothetical protein
VHCSVTTMEISIDQRWWTEWIRTDRCVFRFHKCSALTKTCMWDYREDWCFGMHLMPDISMGWDRWLVLDKTPALILIFSP